MSDSASRQLSIDGGVTNELSFQYDQTGSVGGIVYGCTAGPGDERVRLSED